MEMSKERPKKIKKPFHLKKADLDLDGYRKDIQDRSPALLFDRALNTLKISRQFHLYVALQLLTAYLGFGQVILCIGSYRVGPSLRRDVLKARCFCIRYSVDDGCQHRKAQAWRKECLLTIQRQRGSVSLGILLSAGCGLGN